LQKCSLKGVSELQVVGLGFLMSGLGHETRL
jgi:hypothetical protein